MITKEQIKKAAAMYDSRLSWSAIGEVIGVDPDDLRTECEKFARRAMPDRELPAGSRVVAGFVIEKKVPPLSMQGLRDTYVLRLADAVVAGDCVRGIKSQGGVNGLRKRLAKRGLLVRGVKQTGEKSWDAYIFNKSDRP